MTIDQAVRVWRGMRTSTTVQSLNDVQRHQLVHDINETVVKAIKDHVLTYEEFEARVSA
jgi:hypothetical protein